MLVECTIHDFIRWRCWPTLGKLKTLRVRQSCDSNRDLMLRSPIATRTSTNGGIAGTTLRQAPVAKLGSFGSLLIFILIVFERLWQGPRKRRLRKGQSHVQPSLQSDLGLQSMLRYWYSSQDAVASFVSRKLERIDVNTNANASRKLKWIRKWNWNRHHGIAASSTKIKKHKQWTKRLVSGGRTRRAHPDPRSNNQEHPWMNHVCLQI